MATEHVLTRAGIRIAYRDYGGSGIPLVLIHGGGRTLADWNNVVPPLQDAHRIVSLDLRGHGQSDEAETFDFDDVIADVHAVVEACGLEAPVTVGHSLGGMVASIYADVHTSARAAVNVDGSGQTLPTRWPGYGTERALAHFAGEKAKEAQMPERQEEGDTAWRDAQIAQFRTSIESMGQDWSRWEDTAARSYIDLGNGRWRNSSTMSSMKKMLSSVGNVNLWPYYHRIEQPLLIILAGGGGQQGDGEMAEWMKAFREGMELDYADLLAKRDNVKIARVDCGHMVPLERPEWLAETLLEFTQSLA